MTWMTPFSASTSAWITVASLTVTPPLTAILSTPPSTVFCSLSCVIWADVIRPGDDVIGQHPGERGRVCEETLHGPLRERCEGVVGRREDGERSSVGEGLAEAGGIDGGEQGLERPCLSCGFNDVVRHVASFLSGRRSGCRPVTSCIDFVLCLYNDSRLELEAVKCLLNVCMMMSMATDSGQLRIGEFARRVGVTPELLRAWESRYGLTRPVRSPGGFRLYTAADAARVERMRRGLEQGLSAAEAARAALEDERPSEGMLEDLAARLLAAIGRYDEAAAHSVLDESLAAFGLEESLRQVVLPVLKEVGDGWKRGEIEISEEHFASNLIRGRLLALARFWGRGTGPLALLACAPGEMHDITLLAFALVLRSHSWRILFLGADTPIATLARAAETTRPALVVVSSFDPALLEAQAAGLRRLARAVPLALAGPGATDELSVRLGARRLDGDLVAAADEVART